LAGAASTPEGSGRGIFGQNTARERLPAISRSAGKSVRAARYADAIPIAATGPRLAFDERSERSKHITPAMTVPALALIGAREARHAARMAS